MLLTHNVRKEMVVMFLWVLLISPCLAENPATIKEYKKVFTTYPFSDPSPIPTMIFNYPFCKIYPYFRYDGYTDKPVEKQWKVVELENDYLRVMILPEIGGKVWTAIEKSTGKPFIYYNHVVEFRDVGLRGPWTSGGIEVNYSVLGHGYCCSTPVDYLMRTNVDGSVSCVIGGLDLLTRTSWRLDVNLPKDRAYFTTKSFWYNATPLEQPYYSWTNMALKAAGNLQCIFPGTHHLGHEGEYADWPINKEQGVDISYYERNNFGGYKAYHVFGRYTDFYGGYWHDEDFGMARYARHDEMPGKKVWIWGLSRTGMIWEQLLTDTDGQYVEFQSGRLYNQPLEESSFTPFKNRGFSPYAADTWTEYWFPVKNTKGFVKANPYGALNLRQEGDRLRIYFSPVQPIDDTLEVFDGEQLIWAKKVHLKPLETFADYVPASVSPKKLVVRLGGHKLTYSADPDADVLSRPVDTPKDFDWNSVFGLYLQGKENIRRRFYDKALDALQSCLKKDPNYLPALVDMAMLSYRNLDYTGADQYARKALSIDTYDPGANYYHGLANKALGRWADAKDGFDLATQAMEYRSAAYVELSKLYFCEKDFDQALAYAAKSLDFNRNNLEAYQVAAVVHRLRGNAAKADAELAALRELDPLNHFMRFEKYLWQKASEADFAAPIQNEMPQEIYLELAVWYSNLGLVNDSAKVLELAPKNAELLYWLAYLKQDSKLIEKANAATPHLVFPFRSETARVLDWVIRQSDAWQPKYYLALIYWDRQNLPRAKKLLAQCGNQPDYVPFYAARAELIEETALADLQKATRLDPQQWRYGLLLTKYYVAHKQYDSALRVVESCVQRFPANYLLGLLYAKVLLLNGQYQQCSDLLDKINILPYEAATEARDIYRETKLMLALEHMKAGAFEKAQSFIDATREWPENLGVGKPYQADIDERLEDWLAAQCYQKYNEPRKQSDAWERIVGFKASGNSICDLLTAWALKKRGKASEGQRLLASWVEKEPTNEVARWCRDTFDGKTVILAEPLRETNYRIIHKWLNR